MTSDTTTRTMTLVEVELDGFGDTIKMVIWADQMFDLESNNLKQKLLEDFAEGIETIGSLQKC